MTRIFFFLSLALICQACCTKKKCAGSELPFIVVKFKDLQPGTEQAAKWYMLEKGTVVDSATISISGQSPTLFCFPFETFGINPARSFILKWNGKEQNINGITCDFEKKKVECNKCFPFGDGSEEVETFSNFSFQSGNHTFHVNDTLFVAW